MIYLFILVLFSLKLFPNNISEIMLITGVFHLLRKNIEGLDNFSWPTDHRACQNGEGEDCPDIPYDPPPEKQVDLFTDFDTNIKFSSSPIRDCWYYDNYGSSFANELCEDPSCKPRYIKYSGFYDYFYALNESMKDPNSKDYNNNYFLLEGGSKENPIHYDKDKYKEIMKGLVGAEKRHFTDIMNEYNPEGLGNYIAIKNKDQEGNEYYDIKYSNAGSVVEGDGCYEPSPSSEGGISSNACGSMNENISDIYKRIWNDDPMNKYLIQSRNKKACPSPCIFTEGKSQRNIYSFIDSINAKHNFPSNFPIPRNNSVMRKSLYDRVENEFLNAKSKDPPREKYDDIYEDIYKDILGTRNIGEPGNPYFRNYVQYNMCYQECDSTPASPYSCKEIKVGPSNYNILHDKYGFPVNNYYGDFNTGPGCLKQYHDIGGVNSNYPGTIPPIYYRVSPNTYGHPNIMELSEKGENNPIALFQDFTYLKDENDHIYIQCYPSPIKT
jgi:hypothetical protein